MFESNTQYADIGKSIEILKKQAFRRKAVVMNCLLLQLMSPAGQQFAAVLIS